jgi:hypothetical protein
LARSFSRIRGTGAFGRMSSDVKILVGRFSRSVNRVYEVWKSKRAKMSRRFNESLRAGFGGVAGAEVVGDDRGELSGVTCIPFGVCMVGVGAIDDTLLRSEFRPRNIRGGTRMARRTVSRTTSIT